MPAVCVGCDELVGLFEGEEVEDELAEAGAFVDVVVEDACVRGGEDAVGGIGEIRHEVYNVVAEFLEAEAVGEDVEVEEGVVGRFGVFEGRVDGAGIQPADEQFEGVDGDVGETDALGGRFEEGACQGGAKVGRFRGEEAGVEEEACGLGAHEELRGAGEGVGIGSGNACMVSL